MVIRTIKYDRLLFYHISSKITYFLCILIMLIHQYKLYAKSISHELGAHKQK
jgi:hypothetical protein